MTPAPKILVVFFSRTGTTRLVAEAIARAVQADIEPLREKRSRRGLIGWIRSGYEGTYRRSAPTLPLERNLRDYDLVFVGSPTWNGALSSPVRGFLERERGSLPRVALFATCLARGGDQVLAQMAELLTEPPLARLALRERDVRASPAVWVAELTEAALCAWEQRQARRVAAASGKA